MEDIKILVTGCILFEGQGTEENTIVEVENIILLREDNIDEYVDDYFNNGGDSYMVLETPTKCDDTYIKEDINKIIDELNDGNNPFEKVDSIIKTSISNKEVTLEKLLEVKELMGVKLIFIIFGIMK